MYTINFFFTEKASFKATSVVEITVDRENGIFSYVQQAHNADRTIAGHNLRSVDMDDLLYAVVKDHDDGEITIIPSIFTSFEVTPVGTAVQRQKNIEAEAERVAAYRAEKAPEREAKEAAKYAARRAARKAQYVPRTEDTPARSTRADEPADEAPTKSKGSKAVTAEAPVEAVVPTFVPPTAHATVQDELNAAGLSPASVQALRDLDIMK